MAVDPREVEAMARLRRIMSGEQVKEEASPSPYMSSGGLGEESIDPTTDMKRILQAFYSGANETIDRVQETAHEDRPLRDALATKKTQNGVQMGSWEIKVTEEKAGKLYDVVNVHTGEAIAMDLTLYESALSITKLLNFHVGINSPQIRKVLEMEDQYARCRQDAIVFKHRAKQRQQAGDSFRAAVAEDRFEENRAQAIKLREDIIKYSRTL